MFDSYWMLDFNSYNSRLVFLIGTVRFFEPRENIFFCFCVIFRILVHTYVDVTNFNRVLLENVGKIRLYLVKLLRE